MTSAERCGRISVDCDESMKLDWELLCQMILEVQTQNSGERETA